MPLKSILEIDVDDAKFKQFQAAFNAYQQALAKLPVAWRNVGGSITAAHANFATMASSVAANNAALTKAAQNQQLFGQHAATSARHMTALQRTTVSVAQHIREATRDLLKWTTVLSAVSGLAGFGGLFGITRLAQTAGQTRQTAQSLGITYGEQRQFDVAFGRFGAGNLPSTVFQGKTDVTSDQYVALRNLGFTDQQIQNMDAAQLAAAALPRLQGWAKRQTERTLAPMGEANRFTSLVDVGTLMNLRRTSEGELAERERTFQAGAGGRPDDRVAQAWQHLSETLTIAERKISDAFIVGLDKLTPGLEKLSNAVVDFIDKFAKSDAFQHWMDLAAQGLERLGNYLTSDQFQRDINKFVEGVGRLAAYAETLAAAIGKITPQVTELSHDIDEMVSSVQNFWKSMPGQEGFEPKRAPDAGPSVFDRWWKGEFSQPGNEWWRRALGAINPIGSAHAAEANIDETVRAFRASGWTPEAIAGGPVAIAMGEGGFGSNWTKARAPGEESYGPWQLNFKGGEGTNYDRWLKAHPEAGDRFAIGTQDKFIAERLEQIYPGYGQLTDPIKANLIMEKLFERHAGSDLGRELHYVPRAMEMVGERIRSAMSGPRVSRSTANAVAALGAPGAPPVANNPWQAQPWATAWGRITVDNRTGGSSIISSSILGATP